MLIDPKDENENIICYNRSEIYIAFKIIEFMILHNYTVGYKNSIAYFFLLGKKNMVISWLIYFG